MMVFEKRIGCQLSCCHVVLVVALFNGIRECVVMRCSFFFASSWLCSV